jgi:hypothetical protein
MSVRHRPTSSAIVPYGEQLEDLDGDGDEDGETSFDTATAKATLHAFAAEAMRMQRELKEAAAVHKRLERDCDAARAECVRRQAEFEVLTNANKAMLRLFEKDRLRRMGLFWYLMVCVTLFFLLGAVQRPSYGYAALNLCGFLLVWRGLYVEENRGPMGVSLLIVLSTIKFM